MLARAPNGNAISAFAMMMDELRYRLHRDISQSRENSWETKSGGGICAAIFERDSYDAQVVHWDTRAAISVHGHNP